MLSSSDNTEVEYDDDYDDDEYYDTDITECIRNGKDEPHIPNYLSLASPSKLTNNKRSDSIPIGGRGGHRRNSSIFGGDSSDTSLKEDSPSSTVGGGGTGTSSTASSSPYDGYSSSSPTNGGYPTSPYGSPLSHGYGHRFADGGHFGGGRITHSISPLAAYLETMRKTMPKSYLYRKYNVPYLCQHLHLKQIRTVDNDPDFDNAESTEGVCLPCPSIHVWLIHPLSTLIIYIIYIYISYI